MLLEHLAQRIVQGRKLAKLSQSELGRRVRLDGTAISKIEAGKRQVSALELLHIAEAVQKPIAWFAASDAAIVLSHRNFAGSDLQAQMGDVAASRAQEILLLWQLGTLPKPELAPLDQTNKTVEELAGAIRKLLNAGPGPLLGLAALAETLGLYTFVTDFGQGVEACYCPVEPGLGVAILNGSIASGRRRMSLSHELVHHVFQDAYEITWTEAGSESERKVHAIAGEILAPKFELVSAFKDLQGQGRSPAEAVNVLAFTHRVSLTVISHQLKYARVELPFDQDVPSLGKLDRIELAIDNMVDELPVGISPKGFDRAVARAVRQGLLSPQRAEEILPGESLAPSRERRSPAEALIGCVRTL